MLKKNGHVIHLKCFFETNLIPFQQIAWKVKHMSLHLGEIFLHQFQMHLEREWAKTIDTYYL